MNNLSLAIAAIGIALPLLAAIQVWHDRRARMQLERMQLARIRIQNTRGTPMGFYLEPWGRGYEMPAGGWLRVEATESDENCVIVEIGETDVTVHVSTATLFDENGMVDVPAD
jgi:hypothetical protein